jgi:hypothetical protein
MEKKYCDFMDEITADDLYEGLLSYGMFADKLPPIFTSVPFFDYCQASSPVFSDSEWHDYVFYSSMRNINIPRTFGIPTPMKYQRLCLVLKDTWNELKLHFHDKTDKQEYRVSRLHLRKLMGKKDLFEMNYKNWYTDGNPETGLLFIESQGASKYIVRADISTCFPSIYSHSLPWALVGKDEAKANCKNDRLWYNKIDAACYTMKNGETHGLLIGPKASNLLSEIILTAVDKELYEKGYRYYRCIDDYECYVESYEKAQCFLHDLEDVLREYDLPLNHKKTAILSLPVALSENWVHRLNSYMAITKDSITYNEVNAYLDLALNLAVETGNSAVLNYAIKSLAGKSMTINAKKLAAKRILHMSDIYPYLVQLMDNYVFAPFEVELSDIKTYADVLYYDSKKSHNYEAICYAIYFSLKHGFLLEELDIDWVMKQSDCVLLLMTWLYYLKVNQGNGKATQLKPLLAEAKRLRDVDMDRYWLFCYEVLNYGNLNGYWKGLKKAGVHFIKKSF